MCIDKGINEGPINNYKSYFPMNQDNLKLQFNSCGSHEADTEEAN